MFVDEKIIPKEPRTTVFRVILDKFALQSEPKALVHRYTGLHGVDVDVESHFLGLLHSAADEGCGDPVPLMLWVDSEVLEFWVFRSAPTRSA